ncbi:MAG: ABC transporter permease [Pseudomonadota bacterium]|nr:ABC transporter permease [Pseudomonadota bacterium]
MLQYAVKRILWMIPTFFMISLVVFVLINLAPGNPGQAGGAENGQSGQSVQSESVIFFKRQFNLDKPILVNTRTRLTQGEVRQLIVTARSVEGTPTPAQIIAAKDALEDYGNYLVRHLVALQADDANPDVRRLATSYLLTAATLSMTSETAGDAAAARDVNRERDAYNRVFRDWSCAAAAPPECVGETTAKWQAWWAENRSTYEYTAAETAWAFFFDTRFATYWRNLVHLDFGVSANSREPILDLVLGKLKYSVSLSLTAVMLAYLVAVPLGVYSAVRSGSRADTVLTAGLFVLYSLPTFFTGTVLLQLLSQGTPVKWFPTGDFQSQAAIPTTLGSLADIAWHLALPVATSTSVALAALSRYARTGVIDVIRADYIRTARAKGLEEPVVIIKHAVRNGMIPILTLLGGILPVLVSGSVVIEVVFNIPGMGQFLVESIGQRDYNAVMAVLLASAVLTLVGILFSDLSYALVDPRINLD